MLGVSEPATTRTTTTTAAAAAAYNSSNSNSNNNKHQHKHRHLACSFWRRLVLLKMGASSDVVVVVVVVCFWRISQVSSVDDDEALVEGSTPKEPWFCCGLGLLVMLLVLVVEVEGLCVGSLKGLYLFCPSSGLCAGLCSHIPPNPSSFVSPVSFVGPDLLEGE